MKKLLLSLALVLGVAVGGAPLSGRAETVALESVATEFVKLLAKGDFAGCVARFDSTMKLALPEATLREAWRTLQKQIGPFQKQVRVRVETVGGYDVVFVTCQFEKSQMDAKVVLDEKRQVAGLFFVPTRGEAGPPPYAKPGSVREIQVKVGGGEWTLPGALTMPAGAGARPAVVLVQGSGPSDRDESVGANKPFQDLAWGLAAKGIAVLRYEKRTRQYAAKLLTSGNITVKEETIDDAVAAVALLRETAGINSKRVFVLGHSLGGMVAPRIAEADPNIAGLIIMAGSTRPLEDLIVEQTQYLLSLGGKMSEEQQAQLAQLQTQVARVKALTLADTSSPKPILGAPPRYWLDLRGYDPVATARSLKQPMLILQGQRDYQVTQADFDGWKTGLKSRPEVAFKLYPKLNHLFIAGQGKSTPSEYDKPGHVAETVIDDIAGWVLRTGQ
jgi:dienelactone hydrolase